MKQALDVLEELNEFSKGASAICLPAEIDTAIDALRQAITEAEKQEPLGYLFDWENPDNKNKVVEGWFTTSKEFIKKHSGFNIRPLYIATSQTEWVGLTDEEANQLWENTDDRDTWELMMRVQAKLKEKNT